MENKGFARAAKSAFVDMIVEEALKNAPLELRPAFLLRKNVKDIYETMIVITESAPIPNSTIDAIKYTDDANKVCKLVLDQLNEFCRTHKTLSVRDALMTAR